MTAFWVGFLALVLLLLALDLGVLNRRAHQPSVREAVLWTCGWASLGASFSGVVYFIYEHQLYGSIEGSGTLPYSGVEAALTYLTGFALEESLSIDNLFVMVLIFRTHRIPGPLQHRVLFWGILGAIVMRAGMILGGVWLVTRFGWVMYLFGGYLLLQGVAQLRGEDEGEEGGPPKIGFVERLLSALIPIHREGTSSGKFLLRIDGRRHGTLLLVALISVEGADVVFALDSVPAVLTVSTDPFIVFTSNIFAVLGLRSLYFVIASMMDRFAHLKYALSFILSFVGAKMMLHEVVHIPIALSLGVIVTAILAGVASSAWLTAPGRGSPPAT